MSVQTHAHHVRVPSHEVGGVIRSNDDDALANYQDLQRVA